MGAHAGSWSQLGGTEVVLAGHRPQLGAQGTLGTGHSWVHQGPSLWLGGGHIEVYEGQGGSLG